MAARLGGKRIPVTGERDGADVETPLLCVQHKLGRNRPSYLRSWLDGIRANAAPKGKIGIVIWSSKHERDEDAIVLVSLKDWTDLHGPSAPA